MTSFRVQSMVLNISWNFVSGVAKEAISTDVIVIK